MARPVRTLIIAVSVVLVLLTMQVGVDAKKRSSKRKKRTATRAPLVVVPPTFYSPYSDMSGDLGVSNRTGTARVAQPAPIRPRPSGMGIESLGDSGSTGKKGKGHTIEPVSPQAPLAGALIISEFRLTGPNGFADEFIEIYNDSGADHTVAPSSGTGYAIAASDGILRCSIPTGTVIPARGHYLCVNSVGYSLSTYPAGNGTTATGDATYTTQITDNEDPDGMGPNPPLARQGIALFNTNLPANFNLAARFDAAGPTGEANTLYREGTGLPNLTNFVSNQAWVRDECGKGGSIQTLGGCTITTPKDTDDNAADFYYVDTNGISAGAGQRLGAPGPQNLGSSIQRNSSITENLLDSTVAKANPPNRVRDFTSVPSQNSTSGTLTFRRRFVNNTGASITSLRFRIIDLTTFPAPAGFADMRARNSGAVVIASINDPVTCMATGAPATPPCNVTAQGTTVDVSTAPGTGQPNGGGFNSSMTAGTVTLGTPLANGSSINLVFLFGLQQTGTFKVYVNIEALP